MYKRNRQVAEFFAKFQPAAVKPRLFRMPLAAVASVALVVVCLIATR